MIHLRPAISGDAPLLRRWDKAPHVRAAKGDEDWAWETELADKASWKEPFIAELDGRPIGFLEIIDPSGDEEKYWGDVGSELRAVDIWIGEADCLGQGYGSEMMRQALARCFESPEVTAVLVDPMANNTRAHRFYERLGFRFVEERTFGDDVCRVYRFERADWGRRTWKPVRQ